MSQWPNFKLAAATPNASWPLDSIRSSLESYWERRKNPTDADAEQRRSTDRLVYKTYVNTPSTVSTEAEVYQTQNTVTDPTLQVGSTNGANVLYAFTGDWEIQRINIDDNQNSTSVMTTILTLVGEWLDIP